MSLLDKTNLDLVDATADVSLSSALRDREASFFSFASENRQYWTTVPSWGPNLTGDRVALPSEYATLVVLIVFINRILLYQICESCQRLVSVDHKKERTVRVRCALTITDERSRNQ